MKDSIDKLQLTTWIVMVGMFYVLFKTNPLTLYINSLGDRTNWLLYFLALSFVSLINIITRHSLKKIIVLLTIPLIFIVLTNALTRLWLAVYIQIISEQSIILTSWCLIIYSILMAHIYSLGFKAKLLISLSFIAIIGLVPISQEFTLIILRNSKLL